MFPDRYSQIFGLGERLGCILNLSQFFDATESIFEFASMSITLAHVTEPERSTDFCHRSRRTQEDFRTRHLGPSNPAWADLAWSPSTLSEPHTSSWGSQSTGGRSLLPML